MSDSNESNPFASRPSTQSRLRAMGEKGFVVVVTRAFGPDGEDLIAHDGPQFSGSPGVKLLVKQGDLEEEVVLSPFFGDPDKVYDAPFEDGKPCQLFCPDSKEPLDKIPGMSSEESGDYYAIYLTDRLADGEMVAVNNIWGNTSSRMLSEDEVLLLLADAEDPAQQ